MDKAALHTSDPLVEPASTNLFSFSLAGGKLIFFHGDSDPWFSPLDTLDYYKSLAAANGGAEKVAEWSRIFLVPGMGHCGGSPALDHFDMLSAVVDWVEKRTAPESVVATGQAFPGRSRPRSVLIPSTRNTPAPETLRTRAISAANSFCNTSCSSSTWHSNNTNSATSHISRGAFRRSLPASSNLPQSNSDDVGHDSFDGSENGRLNTTAPPRVDGDEGFCSPYRKMRDQQDDCGNNHRWYTRHKEEGNDRDQGTMAVDKATEAAETIGLLNPSSVVLRRFRASALMSCSLSFAI